MTAPTTTTTRATTGGTTPDGIGLGGMRPASRGASTRSLSAPLETCRGGIAVPSRTATEVSAPATRATATTTNPSRRDGNGWTSPMRPAARSDVDELVEVLEE